jgi:4-amino-4-deoxychorismate lyase
MFLINGLEQDTLAANDRATQFGDGCFTTARIQQGQVALLDAHLQRLQTPVKITIPLTTGDAERRDAAAGAARQGVLKVIISRGAGAGIQRGGLRVAHAYSQRSPYPAHYARWREEGVT